MISYSELIFLNDDVYENVMRFNKMGMQNIELMLDGASWEYHKPNIKGLANKLKATNCNFSVHPPAWDLNLTAQVKELREVAYRIHVDAIKFASEIDAAHVVLHPGFLGSPCFSKANAMERAHEITCELAEVAKEYGVKLGFENVGLHGQSLYSQEEFTQALNSIDPVVSYLIDVGHAHINGWDISALIENVADRLCALHIHDNNGFGDEHKPIGQGTINWTNVFESFKKIPKNQCEYVLEYAPGTDVKYLQEGKEKLNPYI